MSFHRCLQLALIVVAITSGALLGRIGNAIACDLQCRNWRCRSTIPNGVALPCHYAPGSFTCEVPEAPGDNVYTVNAADGVVCNPTENFINLDECSNCDPECATPPSFGFSCQAYNCQVLANGVPQRICGELGQT